MSNKTLYILMTLAMIAWGETWVSAKILSRYLDSDELIFWRFSFTALGLIPVLIYYKLSFKISKQNLFLSIIIRHRIPTSFYIFGPKIKYVSC